MADLPARGRAVGCGHDGRAAGRRGATLQDHGARGQRRQRGSLAARGSRLMAAPATRVLVADDDASLVQTLTWILKENGYEVAVCPGGDGLFAKLEEIKPAILLLDIMMPKVDGLQLLERLKQDERYRDLPVLMVSSMPPEEATSPARSTSPSARWCSRSPAIIRGSSSRPTRTRCCAISRSTWLSIPRSGRPFRAAGSFWWKTSRPILYMKKSGAAGSAKRSRFPPARPSRCRSG